MRILRYKQGAGEGAPRAVACEGARIRPKGKMGGVHCERSVAVGSSTAPSTTSGRSSRAPSWKVDKASLRTRENQHSRPRNGLQLADWVNHAEAESQSLSAQVSVSSPCTTSQAAKWRTSLFKSESSPAPSSSSRSLNSTTNRKVFRAGSAFGSSRSLLRKTPSCESSVMSNYVETDIYGRGFCSMLVDMEEFEYDWW